MKLEYEIMQSDGFDEEEGSGTAIVNHSDTKAVEPPMFKVILHNDDYTPMDFVTYILEKYFRKKHKEATEIMLDVHEKGFGVCGLFPYEVAETKVAMVSESARGSQYPLKCTMEAE